MNSPIKISAILLAFALDVSANPVSEFDILTKLDNGPGNVTITDNGRIIMSLHQFYAPKFTVVEVKKDKSLEPFPNDEISNHESQATLKLDTVLGIRSDKNGIVWMLDNGLRSPTTPKLVGWDTKTNKLQQEIKLPVPISAKDSFVNDFAVDTTHNHIYISDPAGGANAAIIVVNLKSGSTRRVLEGDKSVIPENIDLIIDNTPVQIKDKTAKLFRPHLGVNPITEDLDNEWVYYGPMNGHSLYRVKANDLVDEKMDSQTLASRVQRYSDKPI
jgi:hypothetical protein